MGSARSAHPDQEAHHDHTTAETTDGLRMSFRPGPGTEEELRRLVGVESECCAWADWTVGVSAGNLMLEVRSTGAGIATLHGMFR